jgi:hypothetical protein
MDGWCSQSEAAQRLTDAGDPVSQQQISRYLTTWPEIPRKAGENGQPMLVDFEALKRHRAENIRVQEKSSTKSAGDDDDSAELRRRERLAQTELRELELAKARDEVIPRAAVDRAIQAAAVALQQAHRRSRFERADALEATNDTRAKVALLTEQDSAVEAAFAQALATLASPKSIEEEERAAEEQEIEEAKIADALNANAPAGDA